MATVDINIASRLPNNIEAEPAVLGAILLNNSAYNEAAEHLKADNFFLDSHSRIYSRMVDLAESSRPINVITLVEELDQHKELEAVGDVVYVSSLIDGVREKMTRAGLRRSMEQAFNVESIRPERYDFPENGTAESSRYSVV